MKNMQMMTRNKPSILLIIFLISSSVIIVIPLLSAVTLQLKHPAVVVHTRNAVGTVHLNQKYQTSDFELALRFPLYFLYRM